ncbi:hypothetical protein ACRALDRAFT_1065232 [Sodiomyces alcalophilus JCM 7366]|uniref:uncharacterized protein n=1 Tax=Sodiomyces alcalophilus JCM 7366 TaxID=591952 RepID=UPI0039B58A55
MNIGSDNFWAKLPTILQDIAHCDYAVIDLEMSGGVTSFHDDPTITGLPKEDRAYAFARQAATIHNTLELGLTLLSSSAASAGSYDIASYAFKINNLFLEDTRTAYDFASKQDRIIDFSYSTLKFLKAHGVDPISLTGLETYHNAGVPYLSRQEYAKGVARLHRDRPLDPVEQSELDNVADAFQAEVAETIQQWWSHRGDSTENLVICLPTESVSRNSLYQRIVRQLVYENYPLCETFAFNSNHGMRVKIKDEAAEAERLKRRTRDLERALKKQVGLRIVVEALCGGKFADLVDPELVYNINSPGASGQKSKKLQRKLRKWEKTLQMSRPVLVGHNLLYDLCFLYDTFIGSLPNTWSQFKDEVLDNFPRIIDTKVLALQDNPIEGGDPLEDLYKRWEAQRPTVQWKKAQGYGHKAAAHSAGFDSYMTAMVFLAICHEGQGSMEQRLPEWDDGFWDACRNVIRIGRGQMVKLDEPDPQPNVCIVL